MKPTLPQYDQMPDRRRAQLDAARRQYVYAYTAIPGVATARSLPLHEHFSLPYALRSGWVQMALLVNHVKMEVEDLEHVERRDWMERRFRSFSLALPHRAREDIFGMANLLAGRMPSRQNLKFEDYERLFAVIRKTEIARLFEQSRHERDLSFAAQRLAGANPMMLRRIDALPDHFPVTEAQYRWAVGDHDSLAAALSEGRLFLADYAVLDGMPMGMWKEGEREKRLWAPLALFAWQWSADGGSPGLVPVAIQCDQRPGPDNPVFVRDDAECWRMAKAVVQMADGNVHQAIMHLGRTHMVIEAAVMAAARQLAESHPLHVLLKPHFEFTLAINALASRTLINEGGPVDRAFAPTLAAVLSAVRESIQTEFDLRASAPKKELAARRVDSSEGLPDYPYRDDGLLVWHEIEAFVADYVALYYETDTDVRRDDELQSFVREMEERDETQGGRLRGVGPVATLADVIDLITLLIWTATAQHSALNFTQFPCQGLVPNMAFAGFGPGPTPESTHADYLRLLPPMDLALLQFNTTYTLSKIRANRFARYPRGHFADARVAPLLGRFHQRLASVDAEIAERDAGRELLSYPHMRPSHLTQSIHT